MPLQNHNGKFQTYGETFSLDRPHFIVKGQYADPTQNDFNVRIYNDIKSGHDSKSPSDIYDHPSVYRLIPYIIANAPHYPSTSQDPDHLARTAEGHTEVYQLDNVFEMFYNDNIWEKNHSMVVPVFYPYDGRPNKALTVYNTWNPTKRKLG